MNFVGGAGVWGCGSNGSGDVGGRRHRRTVRRGRGRGRNLALARTQVLAAAGALAIALAAGACHDVHLRGHMGEDNIAAGSNTSR